MLYNHFPPFCYSIPTSYIIHAVTWRVCSLVAGMFAQEGQTSFPSSARDNRHHKEW